MLVQFTIGNFLSFKDTTTFSMVGAKAVKEHESSENPNAINIFQQTLPKEKQIKLLKTATLYAANGGGKSNFVHALHFFADSLLESFRWEPEAKIPQIMPFLFNVNSEKQPSFFEIIFIADNIQYRYGFEVDKNKFHSEWLFALTSEKETPLFIRENQNITVKPKFKEGKGKEPETRPNALFLSTVAQSQTALVAKSIRNWFKNNLIFIAGADDIHNDNFMSITINKFLNDPKFKKTLVQFFKSIKIGFIDIDIIEQEELLEHRQQALQKMLALPTNKNNISDDNVKALERLIEISSELQNIQQKLQSIDKNNKQTVSIESKYVKLDDLGNFVEDANLNFGMESKGTQKLFGLFGFWIDCLENNKVLIIDELDSSLHTLITQELVKFFHSAINTKSQLIFTAHDTNLLRKEIFRRDQIWFIEKNEATQASDMYSLVEYKDIFVRNDASFEKGYLEGKYGAIPFTGNIQQFLTDFVYDKKIPTSPNSK